MIEVKVNAAKYAHVFFGISLSGTSTKFHFKDNMLKYENNLKFYGTKKTNFIHVYFILREELGDYTIRENPTSYNSFF